MHFHYGACRTQLCNLPPWLNFIKEIEYADVQFAYLEENTREGVINYSHLLWWLSVEENTYICAWFLFKYSDMTMVTSPVGLSESLVQT